MVLEFLIERLYLIMGLKEAALNTAIKQGIEYVKKDYDTNLFKLISWGKKMVKDELYLKILTRLEERLSDPTNVYADYVKRVIMNTDTNIILKLVPPFVNAVLKSYDRRLAAMKEHGCNIPWAVLIDITTACNLKCKGCWAAEYGDKLNMSYDDLNKITYFEPLTSRNTNQNENAYSLYLLTLISIGI